MEHNPDLKSVQGPKTHQVSQRQLEANRKNALLSTGPRTPGGKRISSRNSLKHGLLSRELVVKDGEDIAEFQKLFAELIEDLQPIGRAEMSLVETVAICDWRFRRTLRAEAEEIALGQRREPDFVMPATYIIENILRYQGLVYRQKLRALEMLEKLQQRRKRYEQDAGTGVDGGHAGK